MQFRLRAANAASICQLASPLLLFAVCPTASIACRCCCAASSATLLLQRAISLPIFIVRRAGLPIQWEEKHRHNIYTIQREKKNEIELENAWITRPNYAPFELHSTERERPHRNTLAVSHAPHNTCVFLCTFSIHIFYETQLNIDWRRAVDKTII